MATSGTGPSAALPADVRDRLAAYTEEMDRRLGPGRLEGLYVVGSVALGDYHERLSNVDVVGVAGSAWTADERAAAARAQRSLDTRRPAAALYVTWAELAADPRTLPGELANPFTWRLLRDDAMVERGPDYPDIWFDDDALGAWARARLADQWRPWLAAARRRPHRMWLRRRVVDRVLTATQLYQAAQGQVLSKGAAAHAMIGTVGSTRDRVLRDAVGYREGSHTSMYWGPVERRRHALDLIGELIRRAGSAGPSR